MSKVTALKQTPLFNLYNNYGAKVIDFGGWALPVQFSGIVAEHETVRMHAGLFDVSHMGEILIEGKDAEDFINHLITNDISKVDINQAQYTAMCYPDGGTVDDLIVYKLDQQKFLLVINAANIEKDFNWIKLHKKGYLSIKNISNDVAQLAIQGPKAVTILQKLTDIRVSDIERFHFIQNVNLDGITDVLVSRTGYTGEDGFELYLGVNQAMALWEKLLKIGKKEGLQPCGLGARDTLRLEACLALYGQDLAASITPLEAGIGFTVKTKKSSPFIGEKLLLKQREEGPEKKLVGLEMLDKGVPRHDYPVFNTTEEVIGYITSGTYSPSLKKSIGLALVTTKYAETGTKLKVKIRNKLVDAVTVKKPFYKK
ncbi:glycine cleavage system aminomethyltransferase GcvT [Gracilibacillus caseinilyticus]|uniref:Aminomethyltransferase n=1 Tax=Gracilibacillus caseinilyticus TaxID=2932256 RepID=A0ABY4EY92_9BACI|nr:glycine cleavage system aminomethyltransferase GcvT [Gracilibacillus caseinilyticus]UOQ49371.1 glycine cleavage system aminomethyltransferase GcvT [Gracilibacillus caseinilyticus]